MRRQDAPYADAFWRTNKEDAGDASACVVEQVIEQVKLRCAVQLFPILQRKAMESLTMQVG